MIIILYTLCYIMFILFSDSSFIVGNGIIFCVWEINIHLYFLSCTKGKILTKSMYRNLHQNQRERVWLNKFQIEIYMELWDLRFSLWWRFISWSSGLWHCLHHQGEDEGSMVLQNICILPHHYTKLITQKSTTCIVCGVLS
jgi:hypothetical protein